MKKGVRLPPSDVTGSSWRLEVDVVGEAGSSSWSSEVGEEGAARWWCEGEGPPFTGLDDACWMSCECCGTGRAGGPCALGESEEGGRGEEEGDEAARPEAARWRATWASSSSVGTVEARRGAREVGVGVVEAEGSEEESGGEGPGDGDMATGRAR